jgi:hypothetical protein
MLRWKTKVTWFSSPILATLLLPKINKIPTKETLDECVELSAKSEDFVVAEISRIAVVSCELMT